MKKLFTYLAILSMMLTAVQPAVMPAFAADTPSVISEAPAVNAVAQIVGEWVRTDALYTKSIVTVNEDGTFVIGDLNGDIIRGTVTEKDGVFTFTKEDGTVWTDFTLGTAPQQEEDDLNPWMPVLYPSLALSGTNTDTDKITYVDLEDPDSYALETVSFVRCDVSRALKKIAGEWTDAVLDMEEPYTLTINEDGTYVYKDPSGKTKNGLIAMTVDDRPGVKCSFSFVFVLDDGIFQFACDYDEFAETITDLWEGHAGEGHFIRSEEFEAEKKQQLTLETISGEWKSDDALLTINKDASFTIADAAAPSITALSGTVSLEEVARKNGLLTYFLHFSDAAGEELCKVEVANRKELSDVPVILPSGVIYFERPDAAAEKAASDEIKKAEGKWLVLSENGSVGADITILKDGGFVMHTALGETTGGQIQVENGVELDGTQTKWYFFWSDEQKYLFAAKGKEGEEVWSAMEIGGEEDLSVVRDMGNAASGDLMRVLVNYIGTWYEADVLDARTLTIRDDASFTLEYRGGGAISGRVQLDTVEFPSGDPEVWLDFYDEEDEPLAGFAVTSLDRTDDIYFGQDGSVHFVRAESVGFQKVTEAPETGVSIKALEGVWKGEGVEGINFYDCDLLSGKFQMQNADASVTEGTVRLEYSLNPDSTKEYWYNLYDKNDAYVTGFAVSGTLPLTELATGQDGAKTFVRVEAVVQALFGDATGDGKITIDDAKRALDDHVAINLTNLSPVITDETARANADVNGDGKITDKDAKLILDYTVMDAINLEPSWYELTKNPNAPDAPKTAPETGLG